MEQREGSRSTASGSYWPRTALVGLVIAVLATLLQAPGQPPVVAQQEPYRVFLPLVVKSRPPGWYLLSSVHYPRGNSVSPVPGWPYVPQLVVAGEILNSTNATQYISRVVVIFYDAAGKSLAYRVGEWDINYIHDGFHYHKAESGAKVPFHVWGLVDNGWASYKVYIQLLTPDGVDYTHNLILNTTSVVTPPSFSQVSVAGTLKNDTGTDVWYPAVYLTVYDANGNVVDVEVDSTSLLKAGQTDLFQISIHVPIDDYSGYALGAEGSFQTSGGSQAAASKPAGYIPPDQLVPVFPVN